MPLEEYIITVFCFVDDFLHDELGGVMIRGRGERPSLSDSEAITIELVGEYLGLGNDKRIWEYFKRHWNDWFPRLPCRTSFVRQCVNIWYLKEVIQRKLVNLIHPVDDLHIFDGFPIPTCHVKRAFKRNPFRGIGDVGYCAAKDQKYFGFKGHLIISPHGLPISFTIAPANVDERDVLPELVQGLRGMIIADKGLIRPALKEELKQSQLLLETPLRSNMTDQRPGWFAEKIQSIRRIVETVIGQLVERFSIQSIRSKDLWHLSAKVGRKILAHTMAFFINITQNPLEPLKFNDLIALGK